VAKFCVLCEVETGFYNIT